jgi:hypothetical protein
MTYDDNNPKMKKQSYEELAAPENS